MATEAYEQLLSVQDLDVQIIQLTHRQSHNPELDAVAETKAAIESLDVKLGEIIGRQKVLDDRQAVLDAEVATIEGRRSEIDGKLYDGSVTATKDLLALQEEAAKLLERQRGVEDSEIEIMELLEPILAELDTAINERAALLAQLEERELSLAETLEGLAADLLSATEEREVAAQPVPDQLLSVYDNLRHDFGGIAVARLIADTCDGCHMSMSAVAVDRLKKEPDDAVVTCDQCGRILIR